MNFRIPALDWLRTYKRGWLRADFVAGITLAAYLLPAALGDASLANLPPQANLYACLFSGLVFWVFCKDMAKRWFKSQRSRLNLLEKYHSKVEKALTSVQAGHFLQIENQLGLFVDVAIASEIPTVGTKGK